MEIENKLEKKGIEDEIKNILFEISKINTANCLLEAELEKFESMNMLLKDEIQKLQSANMQVKFAEIQHKNQAIEQEIEKKDNEIIRLSNKIKQDQDEILEKALHSSELKSKVHELDDEILRLEQKVILLNEMLVKNNEENFQEKFLIEKKYMSSAKIRFDCAYRSYNEEDNKAQCANYDLLKLRSIQNEKIEELKDLEDCIRVICEKIERRKNKIRYFNRENLIKDDQLKDPKNDERPINSESHSSSLNEKDTLRNEISKISNLLNSTANQSSNTKSIHNPSRNSPSKFNIPSVILTILILFFLGRLTNSFNILNL